MMILRPKRAQAPHTAHNPNPPVSLVNNRDRLLKLHAHHYVGAVDTVFKRFAIKGYVKEMRVAPRYLTVGVVVQDEKQLRKAANLTLEIGHRAGIGRGSLEPPLNVLLMGDRLVYQFNLPEYIHLRGKQVRLWKDVFVGDLLDHNLTGPTSAFTVGMGLYDVPIYFGFQTNAPHTLVCGTSGSGKSELMTTMLYQLMYNYQPEHLNVMLVDPKGDLAERFYNVQHLLCQPVSDSADIDTAIAYVHHIYTHRRKHNLRDGSKVLLIIDEADDDRVLKPPDNYQKVLDIAQRGRSLNIHLLMGTHRPDQESLGNVGTELTNRYLGKVANANLSGHLQAGLNLHKLAGQGDFYHVVGGQFTRFQAALTTPQDLTVLPKNPDLLATPPSTLGEPETVLRLPQRQANHRPPIQLTGQLLAHYVYYGPDNIQIQQAAAWGVSKRGHQKYKDEAARFTAAYTQLQGGTK